MRKRVVSAMAMLVLTTMVLTSCGGQEAEPDYDFTVSYAGIETGNVS